MDTESVPKLSGSKASNGTGEAPVADDSDTSKAWYNITNADIFRKRNNPTNGVNCFFSEASFNQIMGPGPSFKEKLSSQIARIKFEQKKQNETNLNKTQSKKLEQKSKLTNVKLSKDAEVCQLPTVLSTSTDVFQNQSCKDSSTVSMNSRKLDRDFKNKMVLNSSSLAEKSGTIHQDLKTNMAVNCGSQKQNENNIMTVNSGSMNQSLNNMAVNSGSMDQSLNIMTVNSGSMDQSLNNMTVNSGSMDQSLNIMTVSSGSMDQSLNNMTVNSGSMDQSLNSMTVNSGSVDQSLNNSPTVNSGSMDQSLNSMTVNSGSMDQSLNSMTVNSGSMDQSLNNMTVNSGSVDQSLNNMTVNSGSMDQSLNNMTVNSGSMDQSLNNSLTVNSGSMDQSLNSMTVNSGSVDQSLNNMTVNSGSVDQSLNNMTVNNESMNQSLNNSLTVNSGSVDQSLNNMTVNSGSVDQSLNNMTVNNESMNQSLNNSLTVNSGSMDQSLNSMTVNSGSVDQSLNNMTVNNESMNQSLNNSLTVNSGSMDQSLNSSLTVNSGSMDQSLNSTTVNSGSMDQSLNSMTVNNESMNQSLNNSLTVNSGSMDQCLNSMTVNSESMNQSLNNSLTVNSGSMDQSLNSMTVNSESINQSLDSVTVNSGSMDQSLNSMTVNSESMNQSLNNSLTVNSSPTVDTDNKQLQLSNSDLVSNIVSLSYSEISDEQKNVNCLNSVEPGRNSSNGIDDIKDVPVVSLPVHVSMDKALNESIFVSTGTNIYTDMKSEDMKHSEIVLDPTIGSTPYGVDELSQCFSEDSLHTSVSVTRESTEKNVKEATVVTSSMSCPSVTLSDAAICEIATSTGTASATVTSISLDTEANISSIVSQNSKPSDSDSKSEYFRHGEIQQNGSDEQNGSIESLPITQNLNTTAEVTSAEKQTQELSENLKADTADDCICSEEEMPLVLNIAELPEKNLQNSSLLDKDPAEDKNLLSPPQDAHELCLVMPSLSSDDDDDDDDDDESNFKDNISSDVHKHPHNEGVLIKNKLDTSLSLNTQPLPAVNISTSNSLDTVHDCGSTSFSSLPTTVNSKDVDNAVTQFQTDTQACSGENNMADTHNMETQSCQAMLDIPYENSADWQTTLVPPWSDIDIPIFSVKKSSPEPAKCRKSTTDKQESKQLPESVDKGDRPFSETSLAKDGAAKEDVKRTPGLLRSDLTRAEHATYLKLYNRYVHFFMQRGPPPVLTPLQCNEIAAFEALQRRVQAEQAEFQNYLLQNAKKNPKSYSFLRTVARNYANCKAKSYRVKLKCASKYRETYDCHIPFCAATSPVMLVFQQALLEIGVPPRIKLPDIQAGHKPVPIPYDIRKIDISFPRYSKNTIPGFTHHEHVSYDINVETLAAKYDFQVAMSSSVMKCLLNNHGPEFERAWNIPIHVLEHSIDGESRIIVYLDKPLFQDDLHVKDYSTLFHKYALRTFVSHPKSKPTPVIKQLFSQTIHQEKPCEIDDPFDVSSSNVDSLETFGAGCSKPFKQEKTPSEDAHENVNDGQTIHRFYGRSLRSNRKYKSWDEVTDDVNQFEIKKTGNNLGNIQSVFQKCHQKKSEESETATGSKQPVEDSEYDCEPKKKRSKIDCEDECHNSEKVMSTCASSVTTDNSLFVNTDDSPQSPEADHTEPFSKTQSPLSPIGSPASPSTVDQSSSPKFIIQQIPLSPVREIPSSPVMQSPPSAMPDIHTLPTVATLLPCRRRSPRTRANKSESPGAATSVPQKASSVSKMYGNTGGVKNKLFTPLDSILGPSFVQPEGRNSQDTPKEDPSHYPPPTEVHSSIAYNLWSLGSLNVLIRTRCHGILKDIKKTRKVYFSPKIEYQSSIGLEQVTVSEMTRDWTACFIRPHTNLLRARINAFSSSILMFEELEAGQILRSSLNFQPDIGFQFLDRVLQSLVNLEPGHYLLSHEPGDNFCGIRSLISSSNQPSDKTTPMKKKKTTRADQLPWIPIDPTLLLPHHIANNRIPATFLPKDVEINHNNAGGHNKRNTKNNAMNNMTDNKNGGFWRKFKDKKRGRGRGKN